LQSWFVELKEYLVIESFDHLIGCYMDRFVNTQCSWGKQFIARDGSCQYAFQHPGMNTFNGRYLFQPLTSSLVQQHFDGDVTFALSATSEIGKSKWLCFDSDTESGELERLDAFLIDYGWHTIREAKRVGREGHLWLLFDAPVDARNLITLSTAMMQFANVSSLERFPKSATKYSQVRAPLGIHRKPGANNCRGWFEGPLENLQNQLQWMIGQPVNSAFDAIREAEIHRIPITRHRLIPFRTPLPTASNVRILDLVMARRVGSELVAQCPLCLQEGHDRHQDNLRISLDGSKFCCVYGGPSKFHKNPHIVRALQLM
jgi:hypothetical protein